MVTRHQRHPPPRVLMDEDLRLALEAGGLGTWEWDIPSGRIRWSQSLERIHGLPPGSFAGTFDAFLADVHPEDLAHVQREIKRSLSRGIHQIDYRIVLPDGEVRWMAGKGSVLRTASGEPERMLGVCMDVTNQKRAEEALRLSEQRFRSIFTHNRDAVFSLDVDGTFTSANPVFERLTGFSAEELRGQSYETLVAEDLPRIRDHVARAARGRPQHLEAVITNRSGQRVWVDVTSIPIVVHERVIGVFGIARDVTERKRREERQQLLAEASAVLTASLQLGTILRRFAGLLARDIADWCAIDFLDDGDGAGPSIIERVALAHADPAHADLARRLRRYVHSAQSARGVLGVLSGGEALLFERLSRPQLEDAAMNEDHLAIMLEQGFHSAMIVPMRARGRLLGGITLIRAATPAPFTSEDLAFAHELARRAAFAVDNARLYRRAQEAQEQLRQAGAAKDEFLGLISHELRTPITTIYGGARLLTSRWQELDDGGRTAVLHGIEQETERLRGLIDDLLALSRLELDPSVDLEPVSVRHTIERVVGLFRRSGHAIESLVPETPYTVAGNPSWLEQVLRNLVANSVKYAGADGPITVRLEQHGNSEVLVRVQDRGPGVAPSETERIFESFYRAEGSAKHVSGAGIGLAVCRRLVEAQSGRIWASPRDGGGLEVAFTLPLFEED